MKNPVSALHRGILVKLWRVAGREVESLTHPYKQNIWGRLNWFLNIIRSYVTLLGFVFLSV